MGIRSIKKAVTENSYHLQRSSVYNSLQMVTIAKLVAGAFLRPPTVLHCPPVYTVLVVK